MIISSVSSHQANNLLIFRNYRVCLESKVWQVKKNDNQNFSIKGHIHYSILFRFVCLDFVGPPGRPGERGEDGRNGLPGTAGSPGQCPNDCYYTQLYMQQLQAAHAQQQTKGPSPLSLNVKG